MSETGVPEEEILLCRGDVLVCLVEDRHVGNVVAMTGGAIWRRVDRSRGALSLLVTWELRECDG